MVAFRQNSDHSMIEDFKVTIWYTAPTALRMLMSAGDDIVEKYDLSSLRSILSVGEPFKSEVIKWAKKVYGLTGVRYLVDDRNRWTYDW